MHPRYQEWLKDVFDHPVFEEQWYFELDAREFQGTEDDYAELIRTTFERSAIDLKDFSDAQVNQGLWYLASPTGSNYLFSLRDGDVPLEKKVAGIRSVLDLYRGCFASRCTQTLGHIDEPGASPVNMICYMFWDICALIYLDEAKDGEVLRDAVFSVLTDTLAIPHRACQEAALHGLSEFAGDHPERVTSVICEFLATTKVDPVLRHYAECARTGCVL